MKKIMIGLVTAIAVGVAYTSVPKARAPHYYHVIMLKRKDHVPASDLEPLDSLWSVMEDRMAGFISQQRHEIECNEFDHAVVLEFSDVVSFQQYQNDADHRQILELGPKLIERVLVYSYWK